MYKFWYGYMKPKHGETPKLCYMDQDRFVTYIKGMIFIKTFQKMLKLGLIRSDF